MKQTRMFSIPMLALMALCFLMAGCEYIMIVILPDVAGGMGASLEEAGKLVSVFAAGYAIGTPVITAATSRQPRHRVLLILLALFLAANTLSMTSSNLGVLQVARVMTAVLAGSITALAQLFVREVTPAENRAWAISLTYASMSFAAVVGNPLAKNLSRLFGWRSVFAAVVLMGAVLLPVLVRVLPRTEAAPIPQQDEGQSAGLLHQFIVLRDPRYLLCASISIAIHATIYTVYTYLTPILTDVLGAGTAAVSLILMVMGLCCMGSNMLSGWVGTHGGMRRLPLFLLLTAALFLLMPLLLGSFWSGVAAVLLMALMMYVPSTPVQDFVLELSAQEYPFAAGLCASTQTVAGNIGITIGSFVGSSLLGTLGLQRLGVPAAVLALVTMGLNLALLYACRRHEQAQSK